MTRSLSRKMTLKSKSISKSKSKSKSKDPTWSQMNNDIDFKSLTGIQSLETNYVLQLDDKRHILLKLAAEPHEKDRLYREYRNGRHVNKFALRFPCFIETYHLYHFQKSTSCFRGETRIDKCKKDLQKMEKISINGGHPDPFALAVQFNEKWLSLSEFLNDIIFLQDDLLFVLLQILLPLQALSEEFAHNHLSENTVLLLKLPRPLLFQYEKVSFSSKYLVKLTDYSACTFDENEMPSNEFDELTNRISKLVEKSFGAKKTKTICPFFAMAKESWLPENYVPHTRRIMGTLHIYKDMPMKLAENKKRILNENGF